MCEGVCVNVCRVGKCVSLCVTERAKYSFFALPDPLSCFVTNKICLNKHKVAYVSAFK